MNDMRRIPPQHIEAEMSVLGGILLDNEAINTVIEMVQVDDLYVESHRKILAAMLELREKSLPCDLISLTTTLKKRNSLEAVGGAAYLAMLVDYVPTSANIAYYCRLVKEKAIARRLMHATTDIATKIYDDKIEINDLLDQAQQAVFEISSEHVTQTTVPLKEVMMAAFNQIQHLYERKERITGIPSGFYDLDELTAGFQKGNLIIIAGRPAMGKTALALNIAQHAAIHATKQVPVVIFSMEMSKEELAVRMLCSESRVNANRLRTGHLIDVDFPRLTKGASQLSDGSIFIDDTAGITVLELRAKARRLKASHGLGLVVIDYLQLMRGSSRSENRQQEIAEISRSLKALAKELNVPVIALSQLSRLSTQRSAKERRPVLSDLRESGAIEQDADVVMFVHREEYYDKEDPELKGKAEIIVGKQRNGPIDTVNVAFIGEFTKFENLSNRSD
ncbi:replicative DNA helicase [Geobacter sp. OR-1]|uniref:replicative DNA helicase n=1 Tax=Geobacter sp. OR-1 TaxID=1266765 RepID=UPI0005445530|nr:replicative DNA helicase [Geobacter sp. OR-1]GAM10339.1 replicative DNA helicase [Geobacter sp. OR-1]